MAVGFPVPLLLLRPHCHCSEVIKSHSASHVCSFMKCRWVCKAWTAGVLGSGDREEAEALCSWIQASQRGRRAAAVKVPACGAKKPCRTGPQGAEPSGRGWPAWSPSPCDGRSARQGHGDRAAGSGRTGEGGAAAGNLPPESCEGGGRGTGAASHCGKGLITHEEDADGRVRQKRGVLGRHPRSQDPGQWEGWGAAASALGTSWGKAWALGPRDAHLQQSRSVPASL